MAVLVLDPGVSVPMVTPGDTHSISAPVPREAVLDTAPVLMVQTFLCKDEMLYKMVVVCCIISHDTIA